MLENTTLMNVAIVLVTIIVSMAIHEAMHGYVAHWLGDDTAAEMGRLTLNPLKHIDVFTTVLLPLVMLLSGLPPIFAAKPVPFNPFRVRYGEYGAALIAVSGPLTNFGLAVAGAGLFRIFVDSTTGFWPGVLVTFILVNLGFFVFNMIPFPPLDGSRVLYAIAPEPVQNVMRSIENLGFLPILLVLVVAFQFIGPTIWHIQMVLFTFLTGVSIAV